MSERYVPTPGLPVDEVIREMAEKINEQADRIDELENPRSESFVHEPALERPTDKQLNCIKVIEQKLGITWTGKWRHEAWTFIANNMKESKATPWPHQYSDHPEDYVYDEYGNKYF